MQGPILTFPQGAPVFVAGQACEGFVIVLSGSIKVTSVSEQGREVALYRVAPGEVCLQTLSCLASGSPYSASAVAEAETQLELVPRSEFDRRLSEDPGFRARLLLAISHRFDDYQRLVEDLLDTSVEVRLARALTAMADASLSVTVTQDQLAREIGSAREVVSRRLHALARAGIVKIRRGGVEILDPAALGRRAGARPPV